MGIPGITPGIIAAPGAAIPGAANCACIICMTAAWAWAVRWVWTCAASAASALALSWRIISVPPSASKFPGLRMATAQNVPTVSPSTWRGTPA